MPIDNMSIDKFKFDSHKTYALKKMLPMHKNKCCENWTGGSTG